MQSDKKLEVQHDEQVREFKAEVVAKPQCPCEGTGWFPQMDSSGDDFDWVECPVHHPSYQDNGAGY